MVAQHERSNCNRSQPPPPSMVSLPWRPMNDSSLLLLMMTSEKSEPRISHTLPRMVSESPYPSFRTRPAPRSTWIPAGEPE